MLIITYIVHKNLLMKQERLYVIIFDVILSSLLFNLGDIVRILLEIKISKNLTGYQLIIF